MGARDLIVKLLGGARALENVMEAFPIVRCFSQGHVASVAEFKIEAEEDGYNLRRFIICRCCQRCGLFYVDRT